jgi:hypothetical protein
MSPGQFVKNLLDHLQTFYLFLSFEADFVKKFLLPAQTHDLADIIFKITDLEEQIRVQSH